MKNVVTYFSPVKNIQMEESTRLLLLWKENWTYHGFNPVVLNEDIARRHRRFDEYEARVSKFPSINPSGYDRACYLRWLAYAWKSAEINGPLICVDYDVFVYDPSVFPGDVPPASTLVSLQMHVPCCVYGKAKSFEKVISFINDYQVTKKDVFESGQPHVSDMHIFYRSPDMPYDPRMRCRNYSDFDWEKMPLVHYANAVMAPMGPRSKNIKQLRNWE